MWQKDEDGFLTYHVYDPVTGLVTETIADTGSSSGLTLPAGWSFIDAGINAETDYSYDPLRRQTEELGPTFVDNAGEIVRTATWTAYLDTSGEVRTASGYETVGTGGCTLVNPISITIDNLDGQVTDQIQAETAAGLRLSRPATQFRGRSRRPGDAAALPTTSYSRWTHNDYATQADAVNGYYAAGDSDRHARSTRPSRQLPPRSSTRRSIAMTRSGQQSEVKDPVGRYHARPNYDVLGLVTSVYVGTSDGTASGRAVFRRHRFEHGRDHLATSTMAAKAAATAC